MHIKVKVNVNAKIEKVIEKSGNSFEISVKEPAERGSANKKILELLRKQFKGYNKVSIVSGHHSKNKIISIS